MINKLMIAWLFPDQMNLHGERGNILALERTLKNADIPFEIHSIGLGDGFHPMDYDLIFCAAGEVSRFYLTSKKLMPVKDELIRFMEEGRVLLVTGTSVGLFGTSLTREDGTEIEVLKILPLSSKERNSIYGDDILSETSYNGRKMTISGCQIQTLDFTYEGEGEYSFARLKYGYGDNGISENEGYKIKNSVFTNTLGPILVTNPWLCDEMVSVMLKNRGENDFTKLNHNLEERSLEEKTKFILNKESAIRKID